jgi:ABC-type Fe3+ transport system permease subunit
VTDISPNALIQAIISALLVWAGYTLQRVTVSLSSVETALKELEKRVTRLERDKNDGGDR